MRKEWNVKEEQLMRENYEMRGAQWCARNLRRSLSSVHAHAARMREAGRLGYSHRPVTEEERRLAVELWQEGKDIPQIAWRLDATENRVKAALASENVFGNKQPPYTETECQEILTRRAQGESFQQIAATIGRTYNSVRYKYYKIVKSKEDRQA